MVGCPIRPWLIVECPDWFISYYSPLSTSHIKFLPLKLLSSSRSSTTLAFVDNRLIPSMTSPLRHWRHTFKLVHNKFKQDKQQVESLSNSDSPNYQDFLRQHLRYNSHLKNYLFTVWYYQSWSIVHFKCERMNLLLFIVALASLLIVEFIICVITIFN